MRRNVGSQPTGPRRFVAIMLAAVVLAVSLQLLGAVTPAVGAAAPAAAASSSSFPASSDFVLMNGDATAPASSSSASSGEPLSFFSAAASPHAATLTGAEEGRNATEQTTSKRNATSDEWATVVTAFAEPAQPASGLGQFFSLLNPLARGGGRGGGGGGEQPSQPDWVRRLDSGNPDAAVDPPSIADRSAFVRVQASVLRPAMGQ